jgi:hypothetical protein
MLQRSDRRPETPMAELLKNKSILMLLAGFALLIVIGIITS